MDVAFVFDVLELLGAGVDVFFWLLDELARNPADGR